MKVLFIILFSTASAFASEYRPVPGKFIIGKKGDLDLNAIDKNSDFSVKNSLFGLIDSGKNLGPKTIKKELIDKQDDGLTIYEIEVDENVKLEDIESYLKLTGDEYIEPLYQIKIKSLPNDRKWFGQWSLKNYGQDVTTRSLEGKVGADIKILESWALTKGSREIKVGVIDTGIDYKHPDLKKNIWVNEKELKGDPGIDDDDNGFTDDIYGWNFSATGHDHMYYGVPGHPDPMDGNSHGTHVAGTIGAVANNNIGIAGINQYVSLVAIKFLSDAGSGSTKGAYRSILYAIELGVDVINASWGGGAPSRLVKSAIKKAGDAGILFVAAAGNDDVNADYSPSYPADYDVDSIISVAATDNSDQLAWFSNYGYRTTDIAAPGVDILSCIPRSMPEREKYAFFSGTSMAAPHVSGVAALVLAHESGLKRKPIELKERLMGTTDKIPSLAGSVISGGRLNALSALTNTRSKIDEGTWVDVDLNIATARYPSELIDRVWTISYPNAKAYKIHFSKADIDSSFDAAGIFDGNYRKVMNVPPTVAGAWSPAIYTDAVHLNFSTALLQVASDPPFANRGSEGFEVDRISYLVKNEERL
jgi:subtilisin family serine protease